MRSALIGAVVGWVGVAVATLLSSDPTVLALLLTAAVAFTLLSLSHFVAFTARAFRVLGQARGPEPTAASADVGEAALRRRELLAHALRAGVAFAALAAFGEVFLTGEARAQSEWCVYRVVAVAPDNAGDCDGIRKDDIVCRPCVSPCPTEQDCSHTPHVLVSGDCAIGLALVHPEQYCERCPEGGHVLKMCPKVGIIRTLLGLFSSRFRDCWRCK